MTDEPRVVTFQAPASDWGTVTGFAVYDAATIDPETGQAADVTIAWLPQTHVLDLCRGTGRCTCPCALCGAFGDRYDPGATGGDAAGESGAEPMTGPRHGAFGGTPVGETEQPATDSVQDDATDTSEQPNTDTATTDAEPNAGDEGGEG